MRDTKFAKEIYKPPIKQEPIIRISSFDRLKDEVKHLETEQQTQRDTLIDIEAMKQKTIGADSIYQVKYPRIWGDQIHKTLVTMKLINSDRKVREGKKE